MKNKLSDSDLLIYTQRAAATEKTATLELLEYLAEVDRRRLYAARGFSSLFEYVCKSLGYSEAQASERVSAMRLMRRVPEVQVALTTGRLTLTSTAKLAAHVRREKTALPETLILLSQCEGKPTREVEKVLVKNSMQELPRPEQIKPISQNLTRITLEVDDEFIALLEEMRELKGDQPAAELLKYSLKEYIQKHTPGVKSQKARAPKNISPTTKAPDSNRSRRNASRAPEVPRSKSLPNESLQSQTRSPQVRKHKNYASPSRYISLAIRRQVLKRANFRCEYTDSLTERRCEARGPGRLEFDHIHPYGKGGTHTAENLRCLCKTHNLQFAIQSYGLKKISPFFEKLIFSFRDSET